MAGSILLLHVAGWGVLAGIVVPQQLATGSAQVFGLGLGVTAYTLGMRHAFDADHIAAIDNPTRGQLATGGRPVSVGFWFSLGHSTVVLVGQILNQRNRPHGPEPEEPSPRFMNHGDGSGGSSG